MEGIQENGRMGGWVVRTERNGEIRRRGRVNGQQRWGPHYTHEKERENKLEKREKEEDKKETAPAVARIDTHRHTWETCGSVARGAAIAALLLVSAPRPYVTSQLASMRSTSSTTATPLSIRKKEKEEKEETRYIEIIKWEPRGAHTHTKKGHNSPFHSSSAFFFFVIFLLLLISCISRKKEKVGHSRKKRVQYNAKLL